MGENNDIDIQPVPDNSGNSNADSLFSVELPEATEPQTDFIGGENQDRVDVTAESEQPNTDPEHWRGRLSDNGTPYDPEVHAFPPSQTKTGRWRKARRSGPTGEAGTTSNQYRKESENLALLYAMAHPIVLGPDAGLENRSDIIPLTDAIERYMVETGHIEIPAEINLAMAAVGYSATVVQRPTVWERFKGLVSKLAPKRKKSPRSNDEVQS